MSSISLNILSSAQAADPESPSKVRRVATPGSGQPNFEQTLQAMRDSVDLSMADRFLNLTEDDAADQDEDGRRQSHTSLVGMNMLGLNMLSTLARLGPAAPAAPLPQIRVGEELSSALGVLARQFESGSEGSQAIGYDRQGGTSYGLFQLSSRQGSMGQFLDFLQDRAPEWASRLRAAGPANTGSRSGGMPEVWKEIAAESPERLGKLQEEFIGQSHYQPAAQAIGETLGMETGSMPTALREVIFSTAVQHGPAGATRIFEQAMAGLKDSSGPGMVRGLIDKVYELRGQHFGGSTEGVQHAVGRRFESERRMAQALLRGEGSDMA